MALGTAALGLAAFAAPGAIEKLFINPGQRKREFGLRLREADITRKGKKAALASERSQSKELIRQLVQLNKESRAQDAEQRIFQSLLHSHDQSQATLMALLGQALQSPTTAPRGPSGRSIPALLGGLT